MPTRHPDQWLAAKRPSNPNDSTTEPGRLRNKTVLLVDDDRHTVSEIVRHFEWNDVEVSVAHSLAEARTSLQQTEARLDAVITELHLPDGRGESLLPDIEVCLRQPAAIITSERLTDIQPEAFEYRPIALTKPISPARLLRVLKTVSRGYTRGVIQRFVKGFGLSKREMEALVGVAHGLKPKEVAERMKCSEPTAYCHLTRACRKTGSSHYQELMAKLLAFACQTAGHTPPDHGAFVDSM
jgi:DNA-binding NarL/FixJ family response regulator